MRDPRRRGRPSSSRRAALALALASASCSPYRLPPESPLTARLPARVSDAGFYADAARGLVAADARPYAPAFSLWSDGASKRRWVRLPPGATIDSSDMDSWQFPVGTQLWKEFWKDGRRVETRLLMRVGEGESAWAAVAYLWGADQSDAVAAPDGAERALGTAHDVPPARACMTCHGGRRERVLGFSAIQLAHPAASEGEATLDALVAEGRLSAAPARPIEVPGTPTDRAALGYLHANCGSCHNGDRPRDAGYFRPPRGLDLWLATSDLDRVEATAAYRTTRRLVDRDDVAGSRLLHRMRRSSLFLRRMPPLATEHVDADGAAAVERWLRLRP
ncbi:MAG TPA: hypothetical protein VFS43_24640 [Polyangiaceae bacterium]|nr:hypothetical protein [Polyangiaceae bacterium]